MGRHGQLAGAAAPILFPQPFTGGQRGNVARRPPVRREIGQRSTEHLVLIGLCLWMVFILVCHIMSFFFSPSFLSPFFFLFFSLQRVYKPCWNAHMVLIIPKVQLFFLLLVSSL